MSGSQILLTFEDKLSGSAADSVKMLVPDLLQRHAGHP